MNNIYQLVVYKEDCSNYYGDNRESSYCEVFFSDIRQTIIDLISSFLVKQESELGCYQFLLTFNGKIIFYNDLEFETKMSPDYWKNHDDIWEADDVSIMNEATDLANKEISKLKEEKGKIVKQRLADLENDQNSADRRKYEELKKKFEK